MGRAGAALLSCALALPAGAETPAMPWPAAQCAALWLGWTDAARISAYLDETPADAALAARFRQAALDQGAEPAALDASLGTQRRDMARMILAAISGDRISDDLQKRLMTDCEDFARAQGF